MKHRIYFAFDINFNFSDKTGRLLTCEINTENAVFHIFNIYAPNLCSDGKQFFDSYYNLVDTKSWSLNGKCFILVSNTLLHKPFEHKIKSIRDFDFPLWKEYRFLFGWSFLHASYKSYLVIRFCSSILPMSSVRLLGYLSIFLSRIQLKSPKIIL
jgi:hypothetical protein